MSDLERETQMRGPQPSPGCGKAEMPPGATEVLVEMYKSLRGEIASTMGENGQLVRYGVVATGAVWYYALSLPQGAYPKAILAVPAVLALVFLVRAHVLRQHVDTISDHVALIEHELGLSRKVDAPDLSSKPSFLGWDCYWRDRRNRKVGARITPWLYAYWWMIVGVNVLAGSVFMFR